MLKRLIKSIALHWKTLIARGWIAPLDDAIWERIGVDRASPQGALRAAAIWARDLGQLIYSGFRVTLRRWDGPNWSIVFVTDDSSAWEAELRHLLFPEPPTETHLGRAFTWQLPNRLRQFAAQGCLVVCDVNRLIVWRLPEMSCVRVIPKLRAQLDTPSSMDSILAGMARHRRQDLTRISKRGFEYGVSHDPTDFEHFYHHMHVPHITGRFQERARLVSHAAMRDIFQKSDELIVVKYRGRLAAAGLGLPRQHGQTYSLLQLGIDPDGAQEAKQDIVLALYWHAIRRTHAQGLRRIDFGGTPARLGDGLFNFKRRWGMRFERDVTLHTMWTLIMGRNLPAPLIRHLNELALIVEAGKEYRCLACDGVAAGLSEPELAERQHAAARAGLDGLLIITPGREASRLTAPLREPLAAA